MFGITINIDPQSIADLTNALEFILNQPKMSCAKEKYQNSTFPNYINQRNLDNSSAQNKKIEELQKDIEMHQKENARNQEIIQSKSDRISELLKEKSENDKKYNDLKSKLDNELNKSEKKEEEFNNQLSLYKDGYTRKLQQKDEEIMKLNKMLESYSVSFGSDDPGEKTFFEVTKNRTLEESMISSDSLYCANKSGEFYKFTINNDGPIKASILNIENSIEPFCIIQERIEDANTINTISVGKARLIGNTLQIIDKAVISLIKQ